MLAIMIAFTVKYCFCTDADKAVQLKECFYFAPSSGVKYYDEHVCVYVCLSISKTTHPIIIKFSVYLSVNRSSSD